MIRNFEILREHREFMQNVRDERRAKEESRAQKQVEEAAALQMICVQPLSLAVSEPSAEGHQVRPTSASRAVGKGNMYERCAALEDHSASNNGMMQGNRMLLDDVHATRRAQAAAMGNDYHPRGSPDLAIRVRAVQEQSQWMGPVLQGAAYVKARATEEASDRSRAEMEARAAPPMAVTAHEAASGEGAVLEACRVTRPVSACSRTSEAPPPFPSKPGLRPQSAKIDALRCWAGQCASRPMSASRLAAPSPAPGVVSRPAVPSSALCAGGRPLSAARRPASRPGSAGSMQARCRALQDSMRKHQQEIEANRVEIDDVVQFRRSAADRLVQALRQEFAFAMPAS